MNSTTAHPLEREFEYFLAHKDELLGEYEGKYVVIRDQRVQGAYPTQMEAIRGAEKTHQLGTFLVQLCERGDAAHTRSFHSHVLPS